ncbi:signal peptidase II [Acetobacterium bakii]|uniref:Lipoprotein signal peptidase n=1 Tax=Acetobacterium bakii TaxID=52689 RepID=A0A0L6U348_9FIRM|nr:signal peptidase II [Acetobacterium bakii]KNZ42787.1 lipoprotein signal peptidase [Acetobacterium bakii]
MIYISIIIFAIFLDQYSKYLVLNLLNPIESFPLIPNVFHLTYVENTGAAFSLFSDMQLFLIATSILFIGVLVVLLIKIPKIKENRWVNISISLIIGGAAGNLIDRLRFNFVVDFLDFRFINFAIFNFSDIFVVCGSILLVIALLTNKNFLENNDLGKLE